MGPAVCTGARFVQAQCTYGVHYTNDTHCTAARVSVLARKRSLLNENRDMCNVIKSLV